MAVLTFTYETGAVPLTKIIDAFANEYDYEANKLNVLETKAQFARRIVKQYIVGVVKSDDAKAAARTIPPVNEIEMT